MAIEAANYGGESDELKKFVREHALILDCDEHGLVCDYLVVESKQLICAECLTSFDQDVDVRLIMIVQIQDDEPSPRLAAGEGPIEQLGGLVEEEEKKPSEAAQRVGEEERVEGWRCLHCTLINPHAAKICEACLGLNSEALADDPMLDGADRLGGPEMARPVRRGMERLGEGEDDKRQEEGAEGIAEDEGKKVLHSTQQYSSKEIEESDCKQWACNTCTLLNSLSSYICSACYSAFPSLQLHLQRLDIPSSEQSTYLRRRPQSSDEFRRSVVKPTCKTCYRETLYDVDKCTDCQLDEIKARRSEDRGSRSSAYKFWYCKKCTRRNSGFSSSCYYCSPPDIQPDPPHADLARPRKFLEACKKCRAFNVHDSAKCASCRSSMLKEEPKPRKFMEICKSCDHRNKRDTATCEKCYRSMRPPSSQLRRTYQS
jgi:hypothetical protein